MGPDGDRMAVLDERLRVRGIGGLRVVDCSAMPTLVSGNTNGPVVMMAEKAVDMIREDARRACAGNERAARREPGAAGGRQAAPIPTREPDEET